RVLRPQRSNRNRLPRNRSHAEKKIGTDFNLLGAGGVQHGAHLFDRVSVPDGCRSIMACHTAAVKGKTRVRQRQMQRVPYQIVNKECMPGHSQSFSDEVPDLWRSKMMRKSEQPTTSKLASAKGRASASPQTERWAPFM